MFRSTPPAPGKWQATATTHDLNKSNLERFPSQCTFDVETHICVLRIEHIDEKHTKQRKDANMRLYIVYISLETAVRACLGIKKRHAELVEASLPRRIVR